jgi:aryl-alcohol dehydrogenase-like predicted oxidoreductase
VIQRELGSSGLIASRLGLGGNTFGPPRIDEAASIRVVHAALDAGVNFIDTALVYGSGQSEHFVGRALAGRRDEAIIATKFNFLDLDGDPVQRVRAHCHESLLKLGTDRIDLLQIHLPTDEIATADLLGTLADLVKEGSVRAYGASNYASWRLAESVATADALGVARFASVQNQYSLLYRRAEQELVGACVRYGTPLIPYHPLAGGFLSGKYRPGEPAPAGTRGAEGSLIVGHMNTAANYAVVEALTAYAGDHGHSVAELAIAWLVAKPFTGPVITGVSNVDQLAENVRGAHWVLAAAELAEVDALTDSAVNTPTEHNLALAPRTG